MFSFLLNDFAPVDILIKAECEANAIKNQINTAPMTNGIVYRNCPFISETFPSKAK